MNKSIQLLQFLVCQNFTQEKSDHFLATSVLSNLKVPRFPSTLSGFHIVTCWRKDKKFHKELIEFETEDGLRASTAHTDIEPMTDSVFFRWHKHSFPNSLVLKKSTYLTIRVLLDKVIQFESYILVESKK